MKALYRSFQLERTLDLTEEMKISEIYKVDALSEMQAFQGIWNTLQITYVVYIMTDGPRLFKVAH